VKIEGIVSLYLECRCCSGEFGGDKIDLAEFIRPAGEESENEDGSQVLRLPQTVFLCLWQALSRK